MREVNVSTSVPHPEYYQVDAADFLAERYFGMIEGKAGSGKSRAAIMACQMVEARRIIVVCEVNQLYNWENEVALWGAELGPTKVLTARNSKTGLVQFLESWKTGVVVMAYPFARIKRVELKLALSKSRFDVLILDEVHNLNNPKSEQTRAIYGSMAPKRSSIKATHVPTGRGLASFADRVWALTATLPTLSRFSQYYTHFKFSGVTEAKSADAFNREFSILKSNGFGLVWNGNRNEGEFKRLRSECSYLITTKMVDAAVPDADNRLLHTIKIKKIKGDSELLELMGRDADCVELERTLGKLASVANTVMTKGGSIQDFETALRGMVSDNLSKDGLSVQESVQRVKTYLGLAKAKYVADSILRSLRRDPTRKVVVWAWHLDVITYIKNRLGGEIPVEVIHGGVAADKRFAIAQDFNNINGRAKVIISQIKAGGAGINLVGGVVNEFVELSASPGLMVQAMARIDRRGQTRNTYSRVWGLGTLLDQNILKMWLDRNDTMKTIYED